jgi:hypothetical protein
MHPRYKKRTGHSGYTRHAYAFGERGSDSAALNFFNERIYGCNSIQIPECTVKAYNDKSGYYQLILHFGSEDGSEKSHTQWESVYGKIKSIEKELRCVERTVPDSPGSPGSPESPRPERTFKCYLKTHLKTKKINTRVYDEEGSSVIPSVLLATEKKKVKIKRGNLLLSRTFTYKDTLETYAVWELQECTLEGVYNPIGDRIR